MPGLLEKRLLFVTGKGGVGKSTVAAALALAAVRRGKKAIIVEVAQQERMSTFFRHEGVGFNERELKPGLFAISIDPHRSMEEYIHLQVRVRAFSGLLNRSRIFQYLAAATPGLKEMVTIGKIWELAQFDRLVRKGTKYDTVVVDAPATGHGLGVLSTPKTFADIARVGPIRNQAMQIHNFITDPKLTGLLAVTSPEEMPVNETVELSARLRESLGLEFDRIFCNGVYPQRFTDEEAGVLRDEYETFSVEKTEEMLARAALMAAISEHTRTLHHRRQVARLHEELGEPIVELPFLFRSELGVNDFEELSRPVEEALIDRPSKGRPKGRSKGRSK